MMRVILKLICIAVVCAFYYSLYYRYEPPGNESSTVVTTSFIIACSGFSLVILLLKRKNLASFVRVSIWSLVGVMFGYGLFLLTTRAIDGSALGDAQKLLGCMLIGTFIGGFTGAYRTGYLNWLKDEEQATANVSEIVPSQDHGDKPCD